MLQQAVAHPGQQQALCRIHVIQELLHQLNNRLGAIKSLEISTRGEFLLSNSDIRAPPSPGSGISRSLAPPLPPYLTSPFINIVELRVHQNLEDPLDFARFICSFPLLEVLEFSVVFDAPSGHFESIPSTYSLPRTLKSLHIINDDVRTQDRAVCPFHHWIADHPFLGLRNLSFPVINVRGAMIKPSVPPYLNGIAKEVKSLYLSFHSLWLYPNQTGCDLSSLQYLERLIINDRNTEGGVPAGLEYFLSLLLSTLDTVTSPRLRNIVLNVPPNLFRDLEQWDTIDNFMASEKFEGITIELVIPRHHRTVEEEFPSVEKAFPRTAHRGRFSIVRAPFIRAWRAWLVDEGIRHLVSEEGERAWVCGRSY
ncbi:hypothetical protein V5O48_013653 [Marasmius crinis-equi]|uniref:Uncharacterized protein n=1 Tax=Marasmius crinis-equi TaxID=585013 RepID=A0ABR3EZG0_9AGAR